MPEILLRLHIFILTLFSCSQFLLAQQPGLPTKTRMPVLVELFTSEGCSTCPPADRLLTNLKQKQPIEGVQIIALGFHVDYWDHQGWQDRFSSSEFTERQKSYAARFHDEIYTPQLVVDGVGLISDSQTLPSVLSKAASEAKLLKVFLRQTGENLEIQVRGEAHSAEAFVAIVEDGLETSVGGGENQGRQLHHAAVVRDWHALGQITRKEWSATVQLRLPQGAVKNNLQVVGFVQDSGTGKILGLAAVPFGDSSAGTVADHK